MAASSKPFSFAASSRVPHIGSPQAMHLIPFSRRYLTAAADWCTMSSMVVSFVMCISNNSFPDDDYVSETKMYTEQKCTQNKYVHRISMYTEQKCTQNKYVHRKQL